ncbi:MAG: VWA domain-containing protein [Methylococcaceae bacterium]
MLRLSLLSSCFALLVLLTACDKSSNNAVAPNTVNTLKIIAGSELKDIAPMLETIKEKTGVQLDINYVGTLDGAEMIMAQPSAYDVAWFSHAKYLNLLQAEKKVIQTQEKIALSPVTFAIKESLAGQWGWINNSQISWSDIADKIKAGQLTYAMTDPTASNSGFSTVMSVQAVFANKGDVLTAQDVDAEKLKTFFSGHNLTAGSSGFLSDRYLREQAKVDGIFNYESELLKLNRNPLLKEKLVLVYPKEGMVIADYPLILLNKARTEDYQKVIAYLKSAEFQSWQMRNTDRRPVNTSVVLGEQFPKSYLMDLAFPNNIATVNEILFAYLNDRKKPSHSFFVLDLSGSMTGNRISALKQAMNNLTGDDTSLTGKFAQFRQRELVTIITFNHAIKETKTFVIDKDSHGLQDIKTYINSLQVNGGTAIFSALKKAYDLAAQAIQTEPNRFYSVVLMTDGLNQDGINYTEFNNFYVNHANNISGIATFPILFGEANSDEMQNLAQLTGGKVFDSRKSSLAEAFKQIRGYQ